jgi:hypothetical protein
MKRLLPVKFLDRRSGRCSNHSSLGSKGWKSKTSEVNIGKTKIEGNPKTPDQGNWDDGPGEDGGIKTQDDAKGKNGGPDVGHDLVNADEDRVSPDDFGRRLPGVVTREGF